MFPSYLDVPLSQIIGEAGPWHTKEQSGGEDGKKHPIAFGHPQSRVRVLPEAEMEHPREPASIPLDRVGKFGKKAAAPAATQLDTQGKGCEGL